MKYDMRKEPATIRCDEDCCGWEKKITFDQVGEWYQKKCPSCNSGIIANDDEIATAAVIIGLGFLGLVAPKGSGVGKLMRLDTREIDFIHPQPESEGVRENV